jgi:hypothetical protein
MTIWELLRDGQLVGDVRDTLVRFLVGLVFGVVPGVFIGATMGLFRWPRAALGPLVAMFYNVPRIALFPLVLILVGLNEFSNELMIALGPFFTMLITTMGAVMNVEPAYATSPATSAPSLYAGRAAGDHACIDGRTAPVAWTGAARHDHRRVSRRRIRPWSSHLEFLDRPVAEAIDGGADRGDGCRRILLCLIGLASALAHSMAIASARPLWRL